MFYHFMNNELKSMREEAGLLPDQLARKVKISSETVKAIEAGLPGVVQSMNFTLTLKWQAACYSSIRQFFHSAFNQLLPKKKKS